MQCGNGLAQFVPHGLRSCFGGVIDGCAINGNAVLGGYGRVNGQFSFLGHGHISHGKH
jgi:hypothetical protein